jgi:hypothetical protein
LSLLYQAAEDLEAAHGAMQAALPTVDDLYQPDDAFTDHVATDINRNGELDELWEEDEEQTTTPVSPLSGMPSVLRAPPRAPVSLAVAAVAAAAPAVIIFPLPCITIIISTRPDSVGIRSLFLPCICICKEPTPGGARHLLIFVLISLCSLCGVLSVSHFTCRFIVRALV